MTAIAAVLITVTAIAVSALIAARPRDVQPVPWGGRSWEAPRSGPYSSVSSEPGRRRVSRSVWLGLASACLWWFPLAGIPLALAAIGLGLSDIATSARRACARTGVYLAVTGLIAAVAASPIAVYLSSQGRLR